MLSTQQQISKTRKLALLLWSIAQPLQLNDDRKSKGEESDTASAVIIHLQVYKLGGSTQKKPQGSSVKRLCTVYCTHSQRPDWYDRFAHYICTYNTQGA